MSPFWLVIANSGADKSAFEKFVRLINNFSFRYMKTLDGDVGQLAVIMNEVSDKVSNGSSMETISQILKGYAPDSKFIDAFKEISFNNVKLSYYIVYYLEKVMLIGTLPLKHGVEQNLEHIMPKTPTILWWPQAFSNKNSNSSEFREYLWRLGNLLPLPEEINKAIKNKSITEKIRNDSGKDYSSCSLESPKKVEDFLDNGLWTYDSIKKRQDYLADNFAARAWSLNLM